MLRSFNTIQNGIERIMDANDVLANNMANINTVGFKQSKMLFKDIQEVEIKKLQNQNELDPMSTPQSAGSLSLGPEVSKMIIDFSQGNFITTGNKLDFALQGDGFFVVQGANNEQQYTRKGNFVLDKQGFLSTTDGKRVIMQESNKPIRLEMTSKNPENIEVTEDGRINYGKEMLGHLKVVDFKDKTALSQLDGALFQNNGGAGNISNIKSPKVMQGSLEGSNANAIGTMLKSIEASRSYESMTNAMQMTSDTLQKVINQTGRF